MTDFRPIADIRLLCAWLAYMTLGHINEKLDEAQPQEQVTVRAARRIEEHLLTTTLVLAKTLATLIRIWIFGLDLSKAFKRTHWPAL